MTEVNIIQIPFGVHSLAGFDYFIVWILLTKKYLVQNSHKSQSMWCKIPATHRSKSVWCQILATNRSKSVAANKEFNAGFLQRSPQSQLIILKFFIPLKNCDIYQKFQNSDQNLDHRETIT